MKVYLAGPFFNEEQVALVEKLENLIEDNGCGLFSPRRHGIVKEDSSLASRQKTFISNVDAVEDCDLVLAIIDGRDSGTIFEMGVAWRSSKPILTYTDKGYGMNLMLACATFGHFSNEEELARALVKLGAALSKEKEEYFAEALAGIKAQYFYSEHLVEGPKEHSHAS